MDAIIVLLGFFIGIAIFLFLMNRITAIVYNCQSVAFTFFICWGIGIVLAWIAWKIAIIIGVIALILYLLGKFKKPVSADSQKQSANDQTESQS